MWPALFLCSRTSIIFGVHSGSGPSSNVSAIFLGAAPYPLDPPGKGIALKALVVEAVGVGIVVFESCGCLRRCGDAPRYRRRLRIKSSPAELPQFVAGRVVRMSCVPDVPDRWVFHAQPPKGRAINSGAFGGAQLVGAAHAVEHPNVVDLVLLVFVGVVQVERIGIDRMSDSDSTAVMTPCWKVTAWATGWGTFFDFVGQS